MKSEINIGIKGMHCKSCVQKIEERLSELEGIEKVSVNLEKENAKIAFDSEKISKKKIEEEINSLGYTVETTDPKTPSKKNTLRQGLVYGLLPHIGCIAFIAASILGITFATELFKPLLLNPLFFPLMVGLSLCFATLSSIFYLNNNGLLSWNGIKRKKGYLVLMYGSTIAVSLIMMFIVFPITANIEPINANITPITANLNNTNKSNVATGAITLNETKTSIETIRLMVNIPCSGHASLISGEIKKIAGVNSVKYSIPNYFDVSFDPIKTSKEAILDLEVFKSYPAKLV
ncbi:MAG: hypothetical protein COT15_02855 [Candidatus Diapherotrites archaeon CG08_land_8_20_14_0_20_34_12]|nr:MAG: hypothetical protein COT15_02855 [Candidatus Diapherotrites archaeon CG08_land_8_20_14_0_20_34_12]